MRSPQHDKRTPPAASDKLRRLIHDRQHRSNGSKERKTTSLAIRKELQRIRQCKHEEQIKHVLQKRQGLRHIADIKRHQGQVLI